MLVLTNIYNDKGTRMSQFMTKWCLQSVVRSIAHKFGCFLHTISLIQQIYESKKGGKDQESIQSNTTPDPGYHMG